jgi:SAM-dependent methyltransferase
VDAQGWDERYAGSDLVWSAGPNAFVVAEVGDLPPGRALDVACGEGRNALWLAEQGWDVVGIDFSTVGIDKARRIAEHRDVTVDLRVGDVTEPGAVDGTFDLVLVAYLHLPAEQMRPLLEHLERLVSPGGTLLLVGHHVDNLEHGHGGPPDPAVLQDPARLAGWLGALEVERAEAVTRTVDTDDGPRTAIDALLRARRTR